MAKISSEIDYYALLNVNSTATSSEITAAYRKLARIHHPDKNRDDPQAQETFQRILEAYELLLDEKGRQAYDQVRHVKLKKKRRYEQMDQQRSILRQGKDSCVSSIEIVLRIGKKRKTSSRGTSGENRASRSYFSATRIFMKFMFSFMYFIFRWIE